MKQPRHANNFSFRDKNRWSYQARFLKTGLIFFLIILAFVSIIGFRKTKNIILSFSGRILSFSTSVINAAGISFDSATMSKEELFNERYALKNQVANLEAQLATLSALKDENEKLQEMLGRKSEKLELVLGNIIAKPNQSPYDTIVIDAGSNNGIINGARVLARGDIAIGTIVEVSTNISKIKLPQ